jgi:hypothetical protein
MQERQDLCDILREAADLGLKLCYALISPDHRIVEANDLMKDLFGDVAGRPCFVAIRNSGKTLHGCGRANPVSSPARVSRVSSIAVEDGSGCRTRYRISIIPVDETCGNALPVRAGPVRRSKGTPGAARGESRDGLLERISQQGLYRIMEIHPGPDLCHRCLGGGHDLERAMEELTGIPAGT